MSASSKINGTTVSLHKLIFGKRTRGICDRSDEYIIDHINNNGLDNRRSRRFAAFLKTD